MPPDRAFVLSQSCCRSKRVHDADYGTISVLPMSLLRCAEVLSGLQSANWKERLTAIEQVLQQTADAKENLGANTSAMVQAMAYVPGWGEKNFQVSSGMRCAMLYSFRMHVSKSDGIYVTVYILLYELRARMPFSPLWELQHFSMCKSCTAACLQL